MTLLRSLGHLALSLSLGGGVYVADALTQVRCCKVVASGGGGSVSQLMVADLDCAGVFAGPQMATGVYSTSYPTTLVPGSSPRQYLVIEGNGHLESFTEPTLSACGTAATSLGAGPTHIDWGRILVNAQSNYVPGDTTDSSSSQTQFYGVNYDAVTDKIVTSFGGTYGTSVERNTVADLIPNWGAHTFTLNGCYKVTGYKSQQVTTGVMMIPIAWATAHLTSSRYWGAGFGGSVGYATGNTYGPMVAVIDNQSGNSCAPGVDNGVSSTELAWYGENRSTGPSCSPDIGRVIGCDTSIYPPAAGAHPARQAHTAYSLEMYPTTWDAYGGAGYITWDTIQRLTWYLDSHREGIFSAFATPSGFMDTTVTATTGDGNATLATVGPGVDGLYMQVGETFWIVTCTLAADGAGCATGTVGNREDMTIARVTSVNTGTKVITYNVLGYDGGNGTTGHVPVVGGRVLLGALYAHGSPTTSRLVWRAETFAPSQYVATIAGGNAYDVTYADDADFSAQLPYSPTVTDNGSGGHTGTPMSDPAAHQIVVSCSKCKQNIGVPQNVYTVYDVSQAVPAPIDLDGVLVAAGGPYTWPLGASVPLPSPTLPVIVGLTALLMRRRVIA